MIASSDRRRCSSPPLCSVEGQSPPFKRESALTAETGRQTTRRSPKQIAELANGIVDPVLARRAGINTALLGSWDEIVGEDFAECTRPEKIAWARGNDDGSFRPGVLTIACE